MVHPGAELYGSDRMFLESVSGFVEAGHQVSVVLAESGPLLAEIEAVGVPVRVQPIPVLRKAALRPAGLAALLRTAAVTWLPSWRLVGRGRFDLVYVSTLTAPGWLLLGRLRGLRVVCHVHEAEDAGRPVVETALVAPLLLTHRVIANSEFTKSYVGQRIRLLSPRTTVVPNGVISTADRAPREQLTGGLRVAYVGRISPRKGPQVAVEAVRRLNDTGQPAELALVGSVFTGYEWFDRELRKSNQDLLDAGVVHLAPFERDPARTFEDCDVAVVPSLLAESFGNTAVEAMLAGRPVVVSDIGGLPEVIRGVASACAVPPGDPTALANALRATVDTWPTQRQAAWAARDRVRQRFSPGRYRTAVVEAALPE